MKLSEKTKARIILAIITVSAFLVMSAPAWAGPPTHG